MNAAPARILCIEDNPMNWRLVQRLLSQAGYEMHWAEDGLKGCELALELKPTLILLDINLPGLSGFEVATKLRQNTSMDGTLIVALTAKTMKSDRETALVTGCDGFISKPIDPFLFVSQVEGYLGGQRDRLEKGREGAALRQFSQQVVVHLEAQLREAQEGNRKLTEVQAELEQRSQHLSRLLSLSKDIIPIRSDLEILSKVLGQLTEELQLDRIRAYRVHESGVYFQGLAAVAGGFEETPVLPMTHPLVAWAESLAPGAVLCGSDLHQSSPWEQGIDLGLWAPRNQALMLPLGSRSEEGRLWGFLAADRAERPFQPFEAELAALHGGILQVSLENAGLIAHLAETSQALATSYEGLETAYEALKEAQRALGTQNQKTALGGLFMNTAKRLQGPVRVLKEESVALSQLLDQPGPPQGEERSASRQAMDQIRHATAQVDGLVRSLLRRAGRGEASAPEWIHLHELMAEELNLLRAEEALPEDLPVELNFQAPRDLLFGVHSDFAEVLGHLVAHAVEGLPRHLILRTWGGNSHFRIELEDDGAPIEAELLVNALEPFKDLRPVKGEGGGRTPGQGLSACAQLMNAYGGSVQIVPLKQGSLVRLSLPMD
ncbi:response regulator [Geothrix sp. PMB-07]|uniref:response regulator n=1 Tax=Geothrix sp. PMB-07 TaxID=3068640 RepID=UPI0027418590|nr:response regulator [Geothrix sp. PMB-07]WLT33419.1 response regulator [Geothrix sp. PMB-07]